MKYSFQIILTAVLAISVFISTLITSCDSNGDPTPTVPSPTTTLEPDNNIVTFPDPNLEAVIRDAIGNSSGAINREDIEQITELVAVQMEIADLSGLDQCVGLTSLDLTQNQIEDVTPLSGLRNLTTLSLGDNLIDDISPLATLSNLEELNLQGNWIYRISPLSALTKLKRLRLDNNQFIDSITALSNMIDLIHLNISNNAVTDISMLADLPSLEMLDLSENQITDILPIVNNIALNEGSEVNLMDNPLDDLSEHEYIDQLIMRGVAGSAEAQCFYTLKYLDSYNPELVDFVKQQSWYLDGINEEERILINDGLGEGRGYQGLGVFFASQDDLAMNIISNQQYEIGHFELKGGVKNGLVLYDDETQLEPCMNIIKEAALIAESISGIIYPQDTVSVFVGTHNSKNQSAINGTIILNPGFNSPRYVKIAVHELVHAMYMTNSDGTHGAGVETWINEGIAEFVSRLVLEQITVNNPGFLGTDFYVQERYDEVKQKHQKYGLHELSVAEIRQNNMPFSPKDIGFERFKELYDIVGEEIFTDALGDLYYFKQENLKRDNGLYPRKANEYDLMNSVLKFAPDKNAVEDFFAVRIFGE